MTDEEAARLRAQVQEATRVLSGDYTISQARQTALTEEYAETFAAAVERLLDERAAVMEIMRAVAAFPDAQDEQHTPMQRLLDIRDQARALLEGTQP